jgi:hypothetical protein
MNERVSGILRGLGWGFWILAGLTAVAVFLDIAGLFPGLRQSVLPLSEGLGRVLILGVLGFFWIVFAALLLEFLRRELFGASQRPHYGDVILKLGETQGLVRFVPVLGTLVLVVLMNMVVFVPGTIDAEPEAIDLAPKLAFGFFYAVGHFLLFVFTLRAVRNRPFFVLTNRGFLYEPGDVSPGLIQWQDVAGVKETELMHGATSYTGPGVRMALVVTLKDPAKYSRTYNPLLRGLLAVLLPVIRYQAGGSGDMVLAAEDFGNRYEEVKGLIGRFVPIQTA